MKSKIKELVNNALLKAYKAKILPYSDFFDFDIEVPKLKSHGDFAVNIAMLGARVYKMPPLKIAELIVSCIEDREALVEKVEIAGPGFINFYLKASAWLFVIPELLSDSKNFASLDTGRGKRVQLEFVSANPTGPLHIGHGRGAVVGDAMASILSACAYDVEKEYYINDSGLQIHTLGLSVWLRLQQSMGKDLDYPEDCYQGDYIKDLALEAERELSGLLDMKEEEAIRSLAAFAAKKILQGIREDLEAFSVSHDVWFSEQSLYDKGSVDTTLKDLEEKGFIYEKDGAKWFKSSDFGDEKDRVVVRNNGAKTYFASDIAYHKDKYDRGFDKLIDIWGADHHGYIKRVSAAVSAMGQDKDSFQVILVQLVSLFRDGQPVAMSTRAGEFETLRSVIDEVGKDAARFFFLMRSYDSTLDFDLELAKKQSNENPVYYIQYVHARIAGVLRRAQELGLGAELENLALLKEEEEVDLMKHLARFPEVLALSAGNLEPHRIPFYLMELASAFHAYYAHHKFLSEDRELSSARLALLKAVKNLVYTALSLIGITAPDQM